MAMASLAVPHGTRPSSLATFGTLVQSGSPPFVQCVSRIHVLQSCRNRRHASGGALAAVAMSNPPSSVQKKTQYHFLVANAKFMLDEEEHLQELLREKLRHYGERNKEQDFWLVIEPKFLDDFPDMTKRLGRPAVALISTDPVWIKYMKLRIDRVLKGAYEADTLAEATAAKSIDLRINGSGQWTAPYPKYESGWWTPFLPPPAADVS